MVREPNVINKPAAVTGGCFMSSIDTPNISANCRMERSLLLIAKITAISITIYSPLSLVYKYKNPIQIKL